ncbi:MAG TPA: ribosomal protein S18-alanine N-acetyltransferase [Bacillota bacterium]|jgi:ribosomal-protein-alanine N-acetyltransferase|nr:ribosomal protein S18-alanine N-acetyltransferase [Bacillota bacterium]HPZ23051.1 ribosomal protein S18-alanine N-acetyltransferase [Bacillota bacterium]HQD20567.1 ribosomal protein S18-alanine N-acetyltransferase [Bacillota bacterium]
MKPEITITAMKPEHLPQVMAIEKKSFPVPWSEITYYREITENPYANYIVAMVGEEVVGYAGRWLILDESHITNIAVSPGWRRQGVARKLMEHMLRASLMDGANRMTLEVRRSNTGAQKLYEGFDFSAAGYRRGYYTDNNEDALIMWQNDIAAYLGRKEQADGKDTGN